MPRPAAPTIKTSEVNTMLRFLRQMRYASRLALKSPLRSLRFVGRRRVLADHEKRESHDETRQAENDESSSPIHVKQRDGSQPGADERAEAARRMMKGQRPTARLGIKARQDARTERMLRARSGIDGDAGDQQLRITADEILRHRRDANDHVAGAEDHRALEHTGEQAVDDLQSLADEIGNRRERAELQASRIPTPSSSPER